MKSLLRRCFPHATAAGGNAEATAISIVNSSLHTAIVELHEKESDDVGDGSSYFVMGCTMEGSRWHC